MSNDLKYAHANQRLKTRYGFEITKSQWRALGEKFARGEVQGARKNHIGDYEGWVEIDGTWVCAYYHRDKGCIGTFFATPPPMPEHKPQVPNPKTPKASVPQETKADNIVKQARIDAKRILEAAKADAERLRVWVGATPKAVVASSIEEYRAQRQPQVSVTKAASDRKRILEAIRASGSDGMTADEVQTQLRMTHQSASPRVSELCSRYYAITGNGTRRKTRSGRWALVYVVRAEDRPAVAAPL